MPATTADPPGAATTATPPAAPDARVPIAQTGGTVLATSRERLARAFANGPVGRDPDAPQEVLRTATPTSDGPIAPQLVPTVIKEPTDPPPLPPLLGVAPVTTDTLRITYRCGDGATTLVRTDPSGASTALNAPCLGEKTIADTGLQPGTRYCYALGNLSRCATTLWKPYVFTGPAVTQADSDAMAASFDWTHTDPVAATVTIGPSTQQALYSMNVLVRGEEDLYGLRGLGMHTQSQPLLPDEQSAWDGSARMARAADGKARGVWITAVVPGAVYNDLRAQAIAGIASGRPIGIAAMVFRKVNVPAAAVYPNPTVLVTPLQPQYLGSMGLEFNGYAPVTCSNGVCTVQQALFGWLLNKFITVVAEGVQIVVDSVRQVIGVVEKTVRGDVDVTVKIVLKNTDEAFGTGEPTKSAWRGGTPLVLKGLAVRAYQGLAEFTAKTDDQGVATLNVSKSLSGKVCIDLENSRVKIVDTFVARRVCVGTFSQTSTPKTVTVETTDHWTNQLAAMTDAADYLSTVMHFDMAKLSVLTGWQSAILTSLNQGRSFTPCMGRMPNLAANIAVLPVSVALGELAELGTSYDIVMGRDDARSRGVGVHEYGHAAMCELLRNTDQTKAALAWAEVMETSMTGQSPSAQPSVLAEGFADFLALQVVGGTNYATGDATQANRSMRYCKGDAPSDTACFEANAKRCDTGSCTLEGNVRWVVSVLQDAFDRVPDAAERANPPIDVPNDGSHWAWDGAKLVPHHATNQVSATDDDTIQLPAPHIRDIFAGWGESGSLLRYTSFFGGLAKALKANGFDLTSSCKMFAAHEPSRTCPGYFVDAHNAGIAPPPPPPPPPPPSCVSTGNPCGNACGGDRTDNCGNVFHCKADCGLEGLCPCAGGSCVSNACVCKKTACL